MAEATKNNSTNDDNEMSPEGEWVTIKPGGWARFGVYLTVQTRWEIKKADDTTGVAAWRTDGQGHTSISVSPQVTYDHWAMLRTPEHLFLYVENNSKTGDIQVRTGEKK